MNTTGVIECVIPKTASHEERRVRYVPEQGQTHDAKVVVTERAGKRIVRLLCDTYLVEEAPPEGPGRVFLVLKDRTNGAAMDTEKGRADAARVGSVYEVRVLDTHKHGTCTCDGFVASKGRNFCVHFLMMAELLKAGLPNPLANLGADFANTEQDDRTEQQQHPAPTNRITGYAPAYTIPPDQDVW